MVKDSMQEITVRTKGESYYRNVNRRLCKCPICGKIYEARTDYTGRAKLPPLNCAACIKHSIASSAIGDRYELHYMRAER